MQAIETSLPPKIKFTPIARVTQGMVTSFRACLQLSENYRFCYLILHIHGDMSICKFARAKKEGSTLFGNGRGFRRKAIILVLEGQLHRSLSAIHHESIRKMMI